MNAVQVDGVSRRRGGVQILDDITLEVAAGNVLGLLGPNGAGKTSLLSVITGLDVPDRGAVRIHGTDVRRDPALARRHLGLAAQYVGLYPTSTVRRNLELFASLHGLTDAETAIAITEVAAALALLDLLDRQVRVLSAGEQRRAHVAAAMVHRPDVLVLDEPTTSLDPESRRRLADVVRDRAGAGTTVLYATNQIDEAEELADRVAIIDHGRLVTVGAPHELASRHATTVVEIAFDGAAPRPSGPADGLGAVEVDGNVLRWKAPEPETAVTRALALVGEHVPRIRRVDVVRPDLAAVYLALTGRSYEPEDAADGLDCSR